MKKISKLNFRVPRHFTKLGDALTMALGVPQKNMRPKWTSCGRVYPVVSMNRQESTILTFRESYPRMSQEKKHHWISLEESLKGGNHVFCSIHCVDFRFELSRKIRWKHDDKGTPWQVTKSSNLIASRAGARRCSWQVVVSSKWGVSEWVTPKIDSLDWNILFKWVIWIDLGAPPFEETSKWDVTYKKIND